MMMRIGPTSLGLYVCVDIALNAVQVDQICGPAAWRPPADTEGCAYASFCLSMLSSARYTAPLCLTPLSLSLSLCNGLSRKMQIHLMIHSIKQLVINV